MTAIGHGVRAHPVQVPAATAEVAFHLTGSVFKDPEIPEHLEIQAPKQPEDVLGGANPYTVRRSYLEPMPTDVETTRVSSKGQVVIPQAVREKLHLEAGELLVVYGEDDTIVLKRLKVPSAEELEELLAWGERFANEHDLDPADIEKAIRDRRDEAA